MWRKSGNRLLQEPPLRRFNLIKPSGALGCRHVSLTEMAQNSTSAPPVQLFVHVSHSFSAHPRCVVSDETHNLRMHVLKGHMLWPQRCEHLKTLTLSSFSLASNFILIFAFALTLTHFFTFSKDFTNVFLFLFSFSPPPSLSFASCSRRHSNSQ